MEESNYLQCSGNSVGDSYNVRNGCDSSTVHVKVLNDYMENLKRKGTILVDYHDMWGYN